MQNPAKDYYTICPRLPEQTRDYIPVMIAAARICKEPVKYGFDKPAASPRLEMPSVEFQGPLLPPMARE